MPQYNLNELRRFSNEEFKDLRQLIDDTGLDARLRSDYSGRAMYGEQCVAIYLNQHTSESAVLATMLEALFEEAIQDAHIAGGNEEDNSDNKSQLMASKILNMMKHARSDSMGTGSVVYFPGTTAEDNGAPDDDDDGE